MFHSGGFSMDINRHDNLMSEMLAYALILRNLLVERFAQNGYKHR